MSAGPILTAWTWEPSVVLGCCALVLAYLAAVRGRYTPRAPWFFAGVGVLFLALTSPIDALGDDYLFSVHMVQHLLLVLVVAPLLVWGLPPAEMAWLLRRPGVGRIERVLAAPLLAWGLAAGVLWVWHLPALYNAALRDEGIHAVQHLIFLGTAVIYWWPVLAPAPAHRLSPLAALPYLFLMGLSNVLLGVLLTFIPAGLYPAYLHPIDTLGILLLIRQTWGLTPAFDQQLGGLAMWVPGGLVYLAAILGTVIQWYRAADDEAAQEPPAALRAEEWHVA